MSITPLDRLSDADRAARVDAGSCVPLWMLRALIRLLIQKGVLTKAELDAAKEVIP